jgi:hypothetical protein
MGKLVFEPFAESFALVLGQHVKNEWNFGEAY